MAHKKKRVGKAKHRTHRRTRVGATKHAGIALVFGVIGGAIVARIAYTSITLPQYVLQAVEIVGGGALIYFMANEPLLQGVGAGVIAEGAVQLATEAIPGMAGVDLSHDYNPAKRVAGYRDVPRIGNFPKPNVIGKVNQMMAGLYKGVY